MVERSKYTLTAEQLYALPDDGYRSELLHGLLVREPPVGYRHARVVARLTHLLDAWSATAGHGTVLAGDAGFVLARDPDTVLAPDIAFVLKARCPGPETEAFYFEGPPDLAIEVLSPGDRASRIDAKVADYLAAGVRMIWLVDPHARLVRVVRDTGVSQILRQDEELSAPDLLPGFAAPVAALFSD